MNDHTILYHLLFVYPLEDFEFLEGKNNVLFDLIVPRTEPTRSTAQEDVEHWNE